MRRTSGVLIVLVLLSATAQSVGRDGDRASGRVAKTYWQMVAEIFGLKPAVPAQAKPPATNMMMQGPGDGSFVPSPSDCATARLPYPCSIVGYCRNVPSDPRCTYTSSQ